ncbi:ead/Ea22-like family protein [Salmonella enterica subsp. enterica serovar Muenchen]|nr:ead/Ea22-like family protein [Salmonella enterica]EHY1358777.1 ead/Ea22-like family protein [Salmonella enterica subsp. enterica serovar Muenchen]EIA9454217.1 ead/Ea22-like family protein [Salmonella enterica subsp. enterica serovar Muenchen]EIA9912601.1 ead/Ea22-like family protein [Salmonella enterica subsp. enterica serovar Muenchen]EIX8272158.1 ead/Ea22-like family protein [Salmonella enterica subsp. enterica serovar Muenchen]
MNLTEGQLLFRLQDFHGAEQEALGIGDYEFFQESADIANALRELLQARRTIEELTAVVGQRNGECVRLHSLLDAAEKRIAEQREYYEGVIADGSKRIAELESNEVREVGNQFLVVRHPGKTPAIKHCTGDLEEFLRKLIEQDPLVTIDIITHRYYGVGGQWVQDTGEYLQMMQGAGIGVKGE